MDISLEQLSKRYNKEWIFRDLNYNFSTGKNYALVGANGSGKSTLLQILSGYHLATSGEILYTSGGNVISGEAIYPHIALAAPYMELIEEFTLLEHLNFHFKFRKLQQGQTFQAVMESCYLGEARHKFVKNFSSGMKQRLKLALAFYTESEVILLDEPTSNLDAQGISWYHERLSKVINSNRTVIIASNQSYEYESYCSGTLDLERYKQ